MSSAERRALLVLLALGLVGQGVRWWLTRPGQAPGDVSLLAALPPRSPAAHRDSILALARPLGPDERIDADEAPAEALARLPRIGLAMAKRIVADREAHGPFGGPAGLDRVPGIGPGLLAVISPHLTFSAPPPLPGPARAAKPLPSADLAASAEPVDLNSADAAALDALPGIGPAKAQAVIRYREANGPFRAVQELARVPGFGAAALGRLTGRVRVGNDP
jgi:competence ComEA-like helix-hairpin-helix protein